MLLVLVSAPVSQGQAPKCTPDDGSGAPVSCEFGGLGTPRPLRTRNPAITPKPRATPRPRREGDRRVRRCQFESAGGVVTFYDQVYLYAQGDWQPLERLPRTQAECIHSPPVGQTLTPCVPEVGAGGAQVSLGCESNRNDRFVWGVLARVTSRCPVNQTVRAPYPRALVALSLTITLRQDEWRPSEAGEWSAPVSMPGLKRFLDGAGNPRVPGIWRDLTLGMRARRLAPGESWFGARAPLPRWTVEGVVSDVASLTTRFERASYGGARQGRAFDPRAGRPAERFDLPAVQVAVETPCAHWWALRYDVSAPYPIEDYEGGNCFAAGAVGALGADWHSTASGCPVGKERYYKQRAGFQWERRQVDWQALNMRDYGLPSTYSLQREARGGGVFGGVEYHDPQDGIWVPVIETQAVLRSAGCADDVGACPR